MADDATTDQIRRAYRGLVRRYHPDRLGDRAADPRSRAEAEVWIRELNAAWDVLGDPERRARYDQTITVARPRTPYSPFPPGTEPEPPGGFAEWHADTDQRRREARAVHRPSVPARPFRVRLLFGFGLIVLAGIMLIVLLTGTSEDPAAPGSLQNRCVRVDAGPRTTVVPCDEPNDGQVVGRAGVPEDCPEGTTARRLAPGDIQVACLDSSG